MCVGAAYQMIICLLCENKNGVLHTDSHCIRRGVVVISLVSFPCGRLDSTNPSSSAVKGTPRLIGLLSRSPTGLLAGQTSLFDTPLE